MASDLSPVTVIAEKPSDFASLVIVGYGEPPGELVLMFQTDGALAFLLQEKLLVLYRCYAVDSSKVALAGLLRITPRQPSVPS